MNENMKAVMKAAAEDEALKADLASVLAELDVAENADRDAAVAKAIAVLKDHGFEITEADLVWETPAEGEIADEELMAVAGGCSCSFTWNSGCDDGWHFG